jgi:hypothetical protein
MLSKLRPTAALKRLLTASQAGYLTSSGRYAPVLRAQNLYVRQFQVRRFSTEKA